MSVLSLPRIHFFGYTDWSPCTGNNAPSMYDLALVEPVLQQGISYQQCLDWMKQRNPQMLQPNGSWNLYGDNATRFFQAKINGVQLPSGTPAGDPVTGLGVDLQGLIYSDGPA